MAETRTTGTASTSIAADTPYFPPGRYGRRREPRPSRRWPVVLLTVLAVLAGFAIALRLFQQYGQPDYVPSVQRYFDVTDDGISVQFEVYKRSGDPAVCAVRARSANGEEVGRAEVEVGAGTRVTVTYRLATSRRPVVVEVPGCGAA